jgi:hypothetical protein
MSNLSTIFGGGSITDPRKEGLPLFGMWGGSSDMNSQMQFRVFDSNFRVTGSPWGGTSDSTTNYRFGILADGSHAYSMNDHGTDFHSNLTTEGYSSWTNYIKSIYQVDQYPHCFHYTASRDGFVTWQSYHQFTSSFEYQVGWTKLNQVLPEGVRPRRTFTNRRFTMREFMGNSDCNCDFYDYSSHLLNTDQEYATGTGYNEKQKMLVMVHSGDESTNTSKTIHIFRSSVCLNEGTKRIKDFFDNLISTEYFTDTWTNQNVKDWTVVVGNNGYVGFGLKQSNSKRYGVFDCNVKGTGVAITGASRQWTTWHDFAGSTTTSYGATQGHQYYTKFQTTWDGTWGMIYSPYYYYGPGINAFAMSLENPRKFININQTKSGRANPYIAWGRTGFHGGWSDNCDSEVWQTYAFAFDPKDSDHTIQTRVYKGSTSGDGAMPDNNSLVGGDYDNRTGVCSLDAMRTGLHGGTQTTNYPMLMGINWWGAYGAADQSYGGK